MTSTRTLENRLLNWTGTVHYADAGLPACGGIATHKAWQVFTTATVTCKRCIALIGEDEPGHEHIEIDARDENIIRRERERAARQAARARGI